MALRNYWITTRIDGRVRETAGGPQARDGGFHVIILYRENGRVASRALEICGTATTHGDLLITVKHGDETLHEIESSR